LRVRVGVGGLKLYNRCPMGMGGTSYSLVQTLFAAGCIV